MKVFVRALLAALALVVSTATFSAPAFAQKGPAAAVSVSSGPLPEGFVLSAAQEALSGQTNVLIQAFVWGESAQGHDFWQRQHSAGRLSNDGRAILSDWVARYQRGERPGGAGLQTGAPPASFVTSAALEVLGGDVSVLDQVFVWSDTPQGHEFWQSQHDRGQLTSEGRAILRAWVGASAPSGRLSAGPMPEGFLPNVAREVLDGNNSRLISAFVWGETRQGHDYWQAFHSGSRPLTEEAAGYLRDWIARYDAGERPR